MTEKEEMLDIMSDFKRLDIQGKESELRDARAHLDLWPNRLWDRKGWKRRVTQAEQELSAFKEEAVVLEEVRGLEYSEAEDFSSYRISGTVNDVPLEINFASYISAEGRSVQELTASVDGVRLGEAGARALNKRYDPIFVDMQIAINSAGVV